MKLDDVILSLDIATTTGWAFGSLSHPRPFCGSHRLAPPGASDGEVFLALAKWLTDKIAVVEPRRIVFESPMDPRRMGGKTNAKTFRRLITMAGIVEMVGTARGVYDMREASPSEVRQYFIGHNPNREAAKKATIRKCLSLGIEPPDDNAADAAALWFYAAGQANPRVAYLSTPLFAGSK